MTNVISFPARRVQRGTIFCPPLRIHFPSLIRQVEIVTPELLASVQIQGEHSIESGAYIAYRLAEPARVLGENIYEDVTHIRAGD